MYDTSIELIKCTLSTLATVCFGERRKIKNYSCQQHFHPTHEREISELDIIKGIYM